MESENSDRQVKFVAYFNHCTRNEQHVTIQCIFYSFENSHNNNGVRFPTVFQGFGKLFWIPKTVHVSPKPTDVKRPSVKQAGNYPDMTSFVTKA